MAGVTAFSTAGACLVLDLLRLCFSSSLSSSKPVAKGSGRALRRLASTRRLLKCFCMSEAAIQGTDSGLVLLWVRAEALERTEGGGGGRSGVSSQSTVNAVFRRCEQRQTCSEGSLRTLLGGDTRQLEERQVHCHKDQQAYQPLSDVLLKCQGYRYLFSGVSAQMAEAEWISSCSRQTSDGALCRF